MNVISKRRNANMKKTVILINLLFAICFQDVKAKDVRYYCDGECNVVRERCSCLKTCKQQRACCTDYEETCNGGLSWKDTECTPSEEMICPDGYQDQPILVILSLDGFRDTYINREITPTISKLGNCGVKAPYMRSVYPTKTFPNHYTIVTGLYPESHGIISNTIYDQNRKEKFRLGKPSSLNPYWWHGEPIWVTASNQGLKSATYFWPGSEVNITRYPDYYFKYNQSTPLEERVYTFFDWLDKPKAERPSMIALYNHVVDSAGHHCGPVGTCINDSLVQSDDMVEMIMNGLRDRKLDTCVNFLITSDHGMAQVDCENKISFLEDYINIADFTIDDGPFVRIGKSFNDSLSHKYGALSLKKDLECMREKTYFEAFLKYEYLPKRFHYANDKNIEDVHLVVDDEAWAATVRSDPDCDAGGHGFDNAFTDMRAFFTAHGPALKRGYDRATPFENIELYNLMAELLGLETAPNNGTLGSLHDILKNSSELQTESDGVKPALCTVDINKPVAYLECKDCQKSLSSGSTQKPVASNREHEYYSTHMLYGRPRIFKKDAKFCFLVNADYITTYSHDYKMPVISSFVLNRENRTQEVDQTPCPQQDPHLSDDSATVMCKENENNITWTYLFSPSLASGDTLEGAISSNIVPVYGPFKQMWDFMAQSFREWADLYNGTSIHVGPIFDYDYDGHADIDEVLEELGIFAFNDNTTSIPIPTHYFVVATICRNQTEHSTIQGCAEALDDIEVISFIIPNYKEAPCHKQDEALDEWIPRALSQHIARIKDVELLTGISFFTKWLTGESITQEDVISAINAKLSLPDISGEFFERFMNKNTDGHIKTTAPAAVTESTQTTTSTALFYRPSIAVLFISLLVFSSAT